LCVIERVVIVRTDIGLIFCLTTQRDSVVTAVGASQAHINNRLKNKNRDILKCTGTIFYHKQHNERDYLLPMQKIKYQNLHQPYSSQRESKYPERF